jgi:hypothetical protein
MSERREHVALVKGARDNRNHGIDYTGWSISLGASPMQMTEAYPVTAVRSTQTLP